MNPFFSAAAKAHVKQAIEAIEAKTSAEIVVTVRKHASSYRDADYLIGAIVAFAVLLLLTFVPIELDANWFPFEVLAAFSIGVLASANLWLLKALLLPRERKRAAVIRAADAHFHEAKLARTQGRTAILVYVSLFERMVHFACDLGVPRDKFGTEFERLQSDLESTLAARDSAAFSKRLALLGAALGAALPRAADDVNELPDDVT
jgi:putative membrane protein